MRRQKREKKRQKTILNLIIHNFVNKYIARDNALSVLGQQYIKPSNNFGEPGY